MNICTGLLFQQGFIQNPELALALAGVTSQDFSTAPQRQGVAPTMPCEPFKRSAIAAIVAVPLDQRSAITRSSRMSLRPRSSTARTAYEPGARADQVSTSAGADLPT